MTRQTLVAAITLVAACGGASESYDLVIENGTVIDPETGFFEPANVGIRGGTIAAVGPEAMSLRLSSSRCFRFIISRM